MMAIVDGLYLPAIEARQCIEFEQQKLAITQERTLGRLGSIGRPARQFTGGL